MNKNSREAQEGMHEGWRQQAYDSHLAVYSELQPIDRHGSFVDHLFVLRDRGRLTDVGRNLFASPFSEVALLGRPTDDDVENTVRGVVWKAFHSPPRFGRQLRQRSFHGWMFGVRCRPLNLDLGDADLAELSEFFTATLNEKSESSFDAIIGALDAWIEHLKPPFNTATTPGAHPMASAGAQEGTLSASESDRGGSVASLAANLGVAPRTLQRHFRKRTGLAPKRYATVERFSGALRQIALGRESLAHVALGAGYSDQGHLTTDFGRLAGVSPGQFRAMARRQIVPDAVRFFKDADLQNRVRLLVCDSGVATNEVTDDAIRSKGRKF